MEKRLFITGVTLFGAILSVAISGCKEAPVEKPGDTPKEVVEKTEPAPAPPVEKPAVAAEEKKIPCAHAKEGGCDGKCEKGCDGKCPHAKEGGCGGKASGAVPVVEQPACGGDAH